MPASLAPGDAVPEARPVARRGECLVDAHGNEIVIPTQRHRNEIVEDSKSNSGEWYGDWSRIWTKRWGQVNEEIEQLFVTKPKLSKEDKQIAAMEAKEARKRAKAAKSGVKADEVLDTGPRKPTKLELAKLKKAVAVRREQGEDVYTDDELEAAGFLA